MGRSNGGSAAYAPGMSGSKHGACSLSPTKEEEKPEVTAPIQRENDEAKRAMAERALQEAQREREREMEFEREKHRLELERQQREAEAERRRKEREEREKQDRLRRLEEEAAAKRRSPREKMRAILDHFADVTRTSTDRVTQVSCNVGIVSLFRAFQVFF